MTITELADALRSLTPTERDTVLRMAYAPRDASDRVRVWTPRVYNGDTIHARFNGVDYDLARTSQACFADRSFAENGWKGDVEWVERNTDAL